MEVLRQKKQIQRQQELTIAHEAETAKERQIRKTLGLYIDYASREWQMQ